MPSGGNKGGNRSALRFAPLLCLALVSPAFVDAALGDTRPEDLDTIRSDIEQAQSNEQKLDQQAGQLDKNVKALSAKLVKAAAKVQATEADLAAFDQSIATTGAQEQEKSKQLAKRADGLKASLAALARIARQPDTGPAGAIVTGTGPLIDRIRSANLLADMTPALQEEMALLGQELNQLANLRAELENQRASRAATLASLEQQQSELDELLRERKLQTANLRAKQADEQSRIKYLTQQAKSLEQLIEALEKQAAIVRPHPKPKVRGPILEVRPTPKPGTKITQIEADEQPSKPRPIADFEPTVEFASHKGHLRLPAQGKIVRGYGVKGQYGSKGVELAVQPNAQIITPVDAQILFAGPFRSYGGLVILSVGDGYHLLVAGIDQIDAIAGQKLIAGEPVGRLARAGKSGKVEPQNSQDRGLDGRLYVELRQNGKPLNPMPWIKGAR